MDMFVFLDPFILGRFFLTLANGIRVFFDFWQLYSFFRCCGCWWYSRETMVWPAMAFPTFGLRPSDVPDCPGWHSQNRNTLGKPTQHFLQLSRSEKKHPGKMYIMHKTPYKEIGITYPRPPTLKLVFGEVLPATWCSLWFGTPTPTGGQKIPTEFSNMRDQRSRRIWRSTKRMWVPLVANWRVPFGHA